MAILHRFYCKFISVFGLFVKGKRKEGKNASEDPQRETTDYQSITTPCLVSAVSQLVRNLIILAPQDSVASLKNESLIPFFVR